jgi:hypothetical protein
MFPKVVLTQSVQSIIGATLTFGRSEKSPDCVIPPSFVAISINAVPTTFVGIPRSIFLAAATFWTHKSDVATSAESALTLQTATVATSPWAISSLRATAERAPQVRSYPPASSPALTSSSSAARRFHELTRWRWGNRSTARAGSDPGSIRTHQGIRFRQNPLGLLPG